MTEKQSQQGSAGRFNGLLMLLAILTIGGFLVWVTVNSETSQVEVVEGAEESDAVSVDVVDLEAFAASPDAYLDQVIRLDDLAVATSMGGRAYWAELPGSSGPYLIKLDPPASEAVNATAGDWLSVTGRVLSMTDSIVDDWAAQGVIETDGQRAEAEFAITFIEASEATVTTGDEEPGEETPPTP